MREIKFRAFDKQKLEMNTSGVLGCGSSADIMTIEFNGSINVQNAFGLDFGSRNPTFDAPIENFILMQFTGLKDKNGVEIYEGDINSDLGVVVWNDDYAAFQWQYEGLQLMEFEGGENEWCEIIGNIHENPELLK